MDKTNIVHFFKILELLTKCLQSLLQWELSFTYGRDEETDLDETDRNWMLNDMAEDGNVKF